MPQDPPNSDAETRFTTAATDRRAFLALSSTVGAALSLPGNATASASDEEVRFGGAATFEFDGNVSPSGSRDAEGDAHIGGDTIENRVTISHDAGSALEIRDVIPYGYDVAATGGTVVDVDPRRDDGIKIVSIGPDAPADGTLEFNYLVEAPESVGTQRRSGTYDLGPAQGRLPDDGEWVDVDGTVQTHVVVAAEPLQDN